jgi:hypothetical protein
VLQDGSLKSKQLSEPFDETKLESLRKPVLEETFKKEKGKHIVEFVGGKSDEGQFSIKLDRDFGEEEEDGPMSLKFQSSKVLIEELALKDWQESRKFTLLAAFLQKSSGEIELEIAFKTRQAQFGRAPDMEEKDEKDDSFKPQKLPRMQMLPSYPLVAYTGPEPDQHRIFVANLAKDSP